SKTTGCHDITVLPGKDLAAGACMGDGILFDVSDPEHPRVIDQVQDNVNFAFWHSATFNQKANKVVFTDELGGGGGATCNTVVGPNRGANGIYDIVGKGDKRKLVFRSYYKIPRPQADTENCVAHNGSLIPVKGKDLMVQAWYQGGVSVWDFTDSANPKEIGYFDRGPLSATALTTGGSWSAYYYNGHIYSNEIARGLDVLKISDRRTDPANRIRMDELNVQTQPDYFEDFGDRD
ncbi:LVIVD repeat-containing protein, partial [Streptomyces sp. NPDC058757]|uniref:LVIVD repeat-containing protein n=1 Tax=Streptomyces sp. NPDC058757 TaxID=3346626 RepID=UPI0036958A45